MSDVLGYSAEPSPNWYVRTPLYLKIVVAMLAGVVVGLALTPSAARHFDTSAALILRLLGAIAPPLILVAVIRAILGAQIHGRLAGKLVFLLLLNTLVAIGIGLLVANVIRPGKHEHLKAPQTRASDAQPADDAGAAKNVKADPAKQFLDNIPSSLLGPLVDNKVIGVVMIAVAAGLAARRLEAEKRKLTSDVLDTGFDLILIVLHWVLALVPLAVFGKVVFVIGTQGFAPFKALAWFVAAVLVALVLQAGWYLSRIGMFSRISPLKVLSDTKDALVMAFSTGSSTATMPVTYECLLLRTGLREQSASMGALIGSNFNNDGTALYEAMSALFIAQMIGADLSMTQQFMVVLTSVIASVGAAGIPEAGLVTMTLVFTAVGLPTTYIAMLLPVDWFLDRCRTAINVMGDINVSCMIEGRAGKGITEAEMPVNTAAALPASDSRATVVADTTEVPATPPNAANDTAT